MAILLAVTAAGVGCGDDGRDEPALLDQRVVDAVTPISGESLDNVRWLERELFKMRLPFVAACLEERGHPELVPVVEEQFEHDLAIYRIEFPEPDRLLDEGLNPDWGPTPYQPSPPDESGHVERGSRDEAFSECQTSDIADPDVRTAQSTYQGLFDQWAPIVDEAIADADAALEADVGACLGRNGVSPEFTESRTERLGDDDLVITIEDAFKMWVAQRIQRGTVSRTATEDAPTLVECAQPLWDQRAADLRVERESFVEEHREQIARLSALVRTA